MPTIPGQARFLKQNRGQVTIELVIVIGVMIAIVIANLAPILEESKNNKIHAAVRDGATHMASIFNLGYKNSSNFGLAEGDKVVISGFRETSNTSGSIENLSIYIRLEDDNIADSYQDSVGNEVVLNARKFLNYAFNGVWSVDSPTVIGDTYVYVFYEFV